MELKVSIRLFDAQERAHLTQILGLACKRLEFPVLTVPTADADVVFVKKGEPASDTLFDPGRSAGPAPILYGTQDQGASWFLSRPATSTQLVSLLGELATAKRAGTLRRALQVVRPAAAVAEEASFDLVPTDRGFAFLVFLIRLRNTGMSAVLRGRGANIIIIDPSRQDVWVSEQHLAGYPDFLGKLASVEESRFNVMDCSKLMTGAFGEADRASMRRFSFEEFSWSLAHTLTPVSPMDASTLVRRFSLRRWPALTRLAHSNYHVSWSGGLVKKGKSIRELSALGGEIEAAKFYNACLVSGLVVAPQSEPVAQAAPRAGQQETLGTFARILSRLRVAYG